MFVNKISKDDILKLLHPLKFGVDWIFRTAELCAFDVSIIFWPLYSSAFV